MRALRTSAQWIVANNDANPRATHAVAVPYLRMWGAVVGGWQLGRAALIAARHLAEGRGDARFLSAKIHTARFYAEALLPQAASLATVVTASGEAAVTLAAEQF